MAFKKQIWSAVQLKAWRTNDTWIGEIPNQSDFVNNDTLHIADVGVDPTLLINNSTYPIAVVDYSDPTDITFNLDKFETTNVRISDDVAYANALPIIENETERHMKTLNNGYRAKGAHALAISGSSATTPLVGTTGSDNSRGFKKATFEDFIALSEMLTGLKVPMEDVVLLMHSSHYHNLLLQDNAAFKGLIKRDAKVGEAFDFLLMRCYIVTDNAVYNTSNVKRAFNAAAAGTDRISSITFVRDRTFQAKGSVKNYFLPEELNPTERANTLGMRVRGLIMPKKYEGFGAVVSQPV
jgi:hypothetical protein